MGKVKNKPKKNGKMKAKPLPEVLIPSEVAAWLRMSEAEVCDAASIGALPGRLIGSEWRFSCRALNDWLRKPDGDKVNGEMREKGTKAVRLLDAIDPGPGNAAFRSLIGSDEMDDEFVGILQRLRSEANRETIGEQ